jgi:hypothetical protein
MNNIYIRATILILILSAFSFTLKAQEKSGPSKEVTFEYILHEIADFHYYTNSTWPLYDLTINSYDKNKYIINVSHFNEVTKCTYIESLHLDNIKSVTLYKKALYDSHKATSEDANRVNMLSISFKSQSNEVDISCEERKSNTLRDKISISGFDDEQALKLEKAFNHLIKLFGNKFDPNLFGE